MHLKSVTIIFKLVYKQCISTILFYSIPVTIARVFAAFFSLFEFKDCFKLLFDLNKIGFSYTGGEWLLVPVVDVDRSEMEMDGCVIGCIVSLRLLSWNWVSFSLPSFGIIGGEVGDSVSDGEVMIIGWFDWLVLSGTLLPGFRLMRFRATYLSNERYIELCVTYSNFHTILDIFSNITLILEPKVHKMWPLSQILDNQHFVIRDIFFRLRFYS